MTLVMGARREKRIIVFVLLGIFAASFVFLTAFSVTRGMNADDKRQEYFDVYREQAKEYVESHSEIYGENASLNFYKAVSYTENGDRGFLDLCIDTFFPRVPDTIEEFSEDFESLEFTAEINGEKFKIAFTKNESGELTLSSIEKIDK